MRVWKAWLTGSDGWMPSAVKQRRSRGSTASLAPPMTPCALAVDVGGDDVAVDRAQRLLDDRRAAPSRPPSAVVVDADARHLAAACGRGLQRVGERHRRRPRRARRTRRASGPSPCRARSRTRASSRQSALSTVSTAGCVIAVCFSASSAPATAAASSAVDEDVAGERLAEDRRHDRVGLGEHVGDDRARAQRARGPC